MSYLLSLGLMLLLGCTELVEHLEDKNTGSKSDEVVKKTSSEANNNVAVLSKNVDSLDRRQQECHPPPKRKNSLPDLDWNFFKRCKDSLLKSVDLASVYKAEMVTATYKKE